MFLLLRNWSQERVNTDWVECPALYRGILFDRSGVVSVISEEYGIEDERKGVYEMSADKEVSEKSIKLMTRVIPVGYVLLFSLLGFMCPVFVRLFHNPESVLEWPQSLLGFVHIYSMLPAGLVLAIVVTMINRKLSASQKVWFNFAASMVLLVISAGTTFLMVSLVF